jgi:pantoate--beta-alanine ligase
VGVDYMFAPEVEEMYPVGSTTSVEVENLSDVMCGLARPGHFRGVATVVAKLFNIVPAQRAYFGQKDAQQLVIIRKMAADLDFPVEIIAVPTVREPDGVAMSSRNTYLDPQEREQAVALCRSLQAARALVDEGERRAEVISSAMEAAVAAFPLVNLEYIAICDNIFLLPLEELSGEVLVAIAARVGRARLIDNMVLEIK